MNGMQLTEDDLRRLRSSLTVLRGSIVGIIAGTIAQFAAVALAVADLRWTQAAVFLGTGTASVLVCTLWVQPMQRALTEQAKQAQGQREDQS